MQPACPAALLHQLEGRREEEEEEGADGGGVRRGWRMGELGASFPVTIGTTF